MAYLYKEDTLLLYWKTNYLFNIEMQKYYGFYKVNVASIKSINPSFVLSLISIVCFFYKGDKFFKIISILFVFEIIQRYFYFAISPYYMLPAMIFSVLLNSRIINWIIEKKIYLAFLFIFVGIYYATITKEEYLMARGQNRGFAKYIDENVNPCDYVLSGFLGSQSIISKDPHYYWALLGHIDLAGESMGLRSKPNVTELVLNYKPKFIFGGIYYHNYAKNRNQTIPVQRVDPTVISKYYHPTAYPDFYILKPEYRKGICRYNDKTKDWEYDR